MWKNKVGERKNEAAQLIEKYFYEKKITCTILKLRNKKGREKNEYIYLCYT